MSSGLVAKREAQDSRGRRKRRPPAEIRRRLLDSAREEFNARGFTGATTAAIARRADVAEIQMFRYFPTKAELFREAIFAPLVDHFRAFNAEHAPGATDEISMLDGARRYVAELLAFLEEHAGMLVSLFAAQSFGRGQGSEGLQSYLDEAAVAMSRRLDKTTGMDAATFSRIAFGAVLGCVTYRDWLFPQGSAEPAKINAAITDFVLSGIGPHCDLGRAR
jgi:AcrR family transcriptional regulator